MKDKEKTKPTKKRILFYYLILAACLLVIAAITVAIVFSVRGSNNLTIDNNQTQPENPDEPDEPDEPTVNPDNPSEPDDTTDTSTATVFISPVASIDITQKQDLWYNATLKRYYMHRGVDFNAEVGAEVLAAIDGTITEISTSDQLYGGVISIAHENDIITVYRFIDPVEGLAVGDKVSRGDVIATVAASTGIENGDGPHLHFEVYKSGELADPEDYLGTEK